MSYDVHCVLDVAASEKEGCSILVSLFRDQCVSILGSSRFPPILREILFKKFEGVLVLLALILLFLEERDRRSFFPQH